VNAQHYCIKPVDVDDMAKELILECIQIQSIAMQIDNLYDLESPFQFYTASLRKHVQA
jgi:hypothetical protein